MASREQELATLLVLLRRRQAGTSWNEVAAQVAAAGSATAVFDEIASDALFVTPDIDSELDRARTDVRRWDGSGYRLVSVLDPEYPSSLLGIREAPPFLFYEGALREPDAGMSVVGSRSASDSGRRLAVEAAQHLVRVGLTVVSGLAAGIDAAAHRAALEAGGRTVAVLGTGISLSYPASNRALQQEIAQRGLLLSQFYPDAPPTKQSFPMRNATMSGYGLATIVIEAGEHSGARIQARLAGEHGRPVILTDRVATQTTWGEALVDRPNVYVVGSVVELSDAVTDIREAPARLRSALDDLVSA